jgi:hypothetical protein
VSSDEVNESLILKKWLLSHSLIKLRLDTRCFSLWLWVEVMEASDTRLVLRVLDREGAAVRLDLRRAELRYQEPGHEADVSVKAAFEATVVSALSILLRDGTNFVLYELRLEASEE